MKPGYVKLLEWIVGRCEPPLIVPLAKLVAGVVIPGIILSYGLIGIFSGNAPIIARRGLTNVTGLPAISVGIAYVAVGLFLYVHFCWENHATFAGLRDVARKILLLVIAIALAATFGLALV
ncbi:MAG: hypothetical protein JW829_14015 [Pirellulales bacterium]|nr:hypothetical protein [Pirellulales bacterium]